MDSKLQLWQGKLVNQAGRTTQIQAVVASMAQFQLGCLKIPEKSARKLESLQRNYCWNKASKKGCKFIGWKELNKPRRMGGLGFKNTRIFNEALLTKLAWRMLRETEAKWVQLLQARYFRNMDPLYGHIKKMGTWIWQGIQQGLQWIRKFHIWEIGDGSRIEVAKDHWIGTESLQESINPINVNQVDLKVSSLIDHQNRVWKQDILQQLFNHDLISQITTIRIPPQSAVDTLRWSLTKNGSFSVQSTYNAILKQNSQQQISRE
ncbi:uncharacterized protein LOC113279398 [Papaver somniferum]|uniref:uncharacterized protein LOC113279398 n=1 Tax=Papaver somniferum TaxID=3469 RepID=UPI000E6F75AA|nr:uncharacterized protein LOC113279398 [Papaver somniferum]